jgi:hypothetical protein
MKSSAVGSLKHEGRTTNQAFVSINYVKIMSRQVSTVSSVRRMIREADGFEMR